MRHACSGIFAATVALALLAGAAAHAAVVQTAEPFVGVKHHRVIERLDDTTAGPFALPRELVVDILEIDPDAPGIAFRLQPDNDDEPGEVTRMTTRGLADLLGAQIAINADFFDTKPPYEHVPPRYFTDVINLGVSDGEVYSLNFRPGTPVFNVTRDNRAQVLTAGKAGTADTREPADLYNAVGSNQWIVRDGRVATPDNNYTNTLNPHSALGVTRDGHILLMTVDGRQDAYSRGMQTREMAELLIQHFDCRDAINIDGGGSTTLVMDDTDDNVQNARVINSPSDGATAQERGRERLNGNNFAVFATHRSGYTPLPEVPRPEPQPAYPLITVDTVFDDFETDKGRFDLPVTASGTSRGVAQDSTSTLDPQTAAAGEQSLRLDVVKSKNTEDGFRLRFLSGGADPDHNLHHDGQAMGAHGSLFVSLRLEPTAAPLHVALLVDDGLPGNVKLECSSFQAVPADGRWHTLRWRLDDVEGWKSFAGGNGVIDGPNAFLDSIYFNTIPETTGGPTWEGSIWIDQVRYETGSAMHH